VTESAVVDVDPQPQSTNAANYIPLQERVCKRPERVCKRPGCGATFQPATSNHIYCSPRCGERAWRGIPDLPNAHDYVMCQVCQKPFRRLSEGKKGHLTAHGMTVKTYLEQYPDAPLVSEGTKERLSQSAKRSRALCQLGRPRPGPAGGHDESFDKWRMLELWVRGWSYKQIGKELQRTPNAIRRRIASVGLRHGYASVYDWGERVDVVTVLDLTNACGLSPATFSQMAKVPVRRVTVNYLSRKRKTAQRVNPKYAGNIIAWRDGVLCEVLSTNRRRRIGYRCGSVVRALFPKLRQKYEQLLTMMQRCRLFLNAQQEAGAEEWLEYLWAQAQDATAHNSPDQSFVKFLPWAVELIPFFKAHLAELRGPGHLLKLAKKAIAERWKAPCEVVSHLIYVDADPLPPVDMRALLLNLQTTGAAPTPANGAKPVSGKRGKRGLEAGAILGLTGHRIALAWHYRQHKITPYAMAGDVFPSSNSDDLEKARKNMYTLFERHGREIEAFGRLPEPERETAIKAAMQAVQDAGDAWKRSPKRSRHSLHI